MRHIEAQQIENLFAGNIRQLLMDAELNYDKLYEIRLRVGRPLFLTYDGGECFLRKPGQEQYLVTREDLKETLEYVTGYSLYAYEDEIRQGYISVQGGHRVGVTGKVVLDRGRIMGMKYISCINVRLAHEIQGCADKVMSYIRTEKWVANTLIISPPRCGKTTLLRDIIRQRQKVILYISQWQLRLREVSWQDVIRGFRRMIWGCAQMCWIAVRNRKECRCWCVPCHRMWWLWTNWDVRKISRQLSQ